VGNETLTTNNDGLIHPSGCDSVEDVFSRTHLLFISKKLCLSTKALTFTNSIKMGKYLYLNPDYFVQQIIIIITCIHFMVVDISLFFSLNSKITGNDGSQHDTTTEFTV
jgi:hypothetical protein